MFSNTIKTWSQNAQPIASMMKHLFKVHVWEVISAKKKVRIYLFTKNLDRYLYRKILDNYLYDNVNVLYSHN